MVIILIFDNEGGSGDGLLVCDCDAYDEYLISISLILPVSCLVRSALDLCGQSDDTLRLAKWNVHFTAKTSNMTKKDKTCKSIVLLQPCSPITVTGPPWAEEWSTYLEDVSFFWLFNKLFQHVCDPQWVKVPYSPKVKVYSVDLQNWMAGLPWPCRGTEGVRGLPSRIWQLCSFLNKCIGFFQQWHSQLVKHENKPIKKQYGDTSDSLCSKRTFF